MYYVLFLFLTRRLPSSTLFPYTTLFRSSPPTVFGPGQMTVAYSISSDILARVIDGFLSPTRKASLPESEIKSRDRKSTRLNSSHVEISYAVFCLKKKIIIFIDVECMSVV